MSEHADESVTSIASARSALISILGELVAPYHQPVRTAALLYALTGVGFGESASRQAIARAGASGLLAAERDGRETKWALTERTHELFREGTRRVFPDSTIGRWDGKWLIVIVPIPESRRATRKKLYAALRWAGFGNPSAGIWVTPHVERLPEAQSAIDSLGLHDNTMSFIGSPASVGVSEAELVERAWDLDEVARTYEALRARFDNDEQLAGKAALVAHIELIDALRHTPYMDPQLPHELLPEWPGLKVIRRLQELRAERAPAAHAHWLTVAQLD
ncbi:putative PaaX family transcriptional regulator [Gordonia polyisoprenivorans NBRC 16320 = JCM 10675]|uniref:Phenylacetic acid degradation protein PaaX n=1 Tax=Gordonia polyisoprenivorans TaxID=84595 RepID=A0A846WKU9_9ACTN|nr:PaaX family transcriptional regulator C-terminal domain-containing protein [Gordonia polyisoprenivorans]NKY01453.1 phenylacetic acid degradation protein PaaX [Gordonia polyisoprenivorans]GAB26334.1 putative PaaX family transcriptional regulator [Gordonia polyisoprenivorans NBRC 16320 = JCM 10675]